MVSTTNTQNNASAAAETVGGNDDIVTEILVRVPVKPLLRFKCVSKRWLSLISDPHFSRRHHHHNHRRTSLSGIFLRRRTPSHFQFVSLDGTHSSPPFTSLDFIARNIDDPAGIKIIQSCNGLLLCRSVNNILTDQTHHYYVCNPTTKRFSTLPRLSIEGPITVFGHSLAYDPSKSAHYQVVCVHSSTASVYVYQIEIYSSETRAWRPCGSTFVAPFDIVFDSGVFWNGAVHWLSPSGSALCFDVDKEVLLRKMPSLPGSDAWGKRRFRYFGESGGHLHLVEVYGSRTTQFKVFEMARDYSRWFVKYEVDLSSIVVAFPEIVRDFLDPRDSCYYAFIIVFVVTNEEEAELLLHLPGKIISYNLRDRSFKKLCELTPYHNETRSSLQFGWLDAYQYFETLAFV
ncbi:F-box protein At5g07610 [Alnus glutinosa]|uniref:F-box protein At5g07610 n=1 Tax=Alnus glutinosa TaxID=3517 RepID=UPI002D76DC5B|nr:F-box protein At5g07610 [Alnus glutinosa]